MPLLKIYAPALALLLVACQQKQKSEQEKLTETPDLLAVLQQATDSLFGHQALSTQSFQVPVTAPKTLTTNSGFQIDIKPEALTLTDGTPIDVSITECLVQDAFIAADAPTMCNGAMLESAGSYRIEAKQSGKPIAIKKGASLTIRMPKTTTKNMQVFYGSKTKDGSVNWSLTHSKLLEKKMATKTVGKVQVMRTTQIRAGDSATYRPATLAECVRMHYDSTMKARWAYTIANRSWMNRRQEIAYGLQPINFPYDRFRKHLVRGDTAKQNIIADFKSIGGLGEGKLGYALSNMYHIADTVPVYKDSTYMAWEQGEAAVYRAYEETSISQLGWVNIDKFYESPKCDSTTISLNMDLDCYKIYYKFIDINSVMANSSTSPTTNLQLHSSTQLPIGKQIELIVVGIKNNTVYTGNKKLNITRKNNWNLKLEKVSNKVV